MTTKPAAAVQTRSSKTNFRQRTAFLRYLVVIVACLLIIFPFYWMVITSLKQPASIGSWPPKLWGFHVTWSSYAQDFIHYTFGNYIFNSVLVAVVSTILILILGSLAGYAIARLPKGRSNRPKACSIRKSTESSRLLVNSGTVIFQKMVQEVAPSMAAAS